MCYFYTWVVGPTVESRDQKTDFCETFSWHFLLIITVFAWNLLRRSCRSQGRKAKWKGRMWFQQDCTTYHLRRPFLLSLPQSHSSFLNKCRQISVWFTNCMKRCSQWISSFSFVCYILMANIKFTSLSTYGVFYSAKKMSLS